MRKAFHPTEYITEELEARGWTMDELFHRIAVREAGLIKLSLDVYFSVGPTNPNCLMGDLAHQLAGAFDVSPELFENLEKRWLEAQGIIS